MSIVNILSLLKSLFRSQSNECLDCLRFAHHGNLKNIFSFMPHWFQRADQLPIELAGQNLQIHPCVILYFLLADCGVWKSARSISRISKNRHIVDLVGVRITPGNFLLFSIILNINLIRLSSIEPFSFKNMLRL